jgi:hypothetical protein
MVGNGMTENLMKRFLEKQYDKASGPERNKILEEWKIYCDKVIPIKIIKK